MAKEYMIWMDLEFTGLDPLVNSILEIACVITDDDLNIVDEGLDIVIHQEESKLSNMDAWNTEHHRKSGLLEKVRESNESHHSAEEKILQLIKNYCKEGKGLLCGNSIHMDRFFIMRHMPGLDKYLHYRLIDVSTLKELCRIWRPDIPEFKKKKSHRSMDDIRESIEELKHIRKNFIQAELNDHAE